VEEAPKTACFRKERKGSFAYLLGTDSDLGGGASEV